MASIITDIKQLERDLRSLKASKNVTVTQMNYQRFAYSVSFDINEIVTVTAVVTGESGYPVVDVALSVEQMGVDVEETARAWIASAGDVLTLTISLHNILDGKANKLGLSVMGFNIKNVTYSIG